MAESLDAFLTRRSGRSWAEVRRAIQQRRVRVRGVVCKHYHREIGGGDVVELDGQPIADGPDTSTLICHKSAGVACSHAPEDTPLIYDLVPVELRHPNLQTAGRLDRDTTGLILLTIDGRFQISLTAPQVALWKRYRVRYRGSLCADAVARVATGLPLPDETSPCLPARLALHEQDADGGSASLELREGRHHQVKRMILALGGLVIGLHRDRIGGLDLPADLAPGTMRPIAPLERAAIRADSG